MGRTGDLLVQYVLPEQKNQSWFLHMTYTDSSKMLLWTVKYNVNVHVKYNITSQ